MVQVYIRLLTGRFQVRILVAEPIQLERAVSDLPAAARVLAVCQMLFDLMIGLRAN